MTINVPNIVNEIQLVYKTKVPKEDRPKIIASDDAYDVFRNNWSAQMGLIEEFNMLLLDRSNRVMAMSNISKGGISATLIDIKIVFATALLGRASSIILAHNHPSGNLSPSQADIKLTKKFMRASEILDIKLFDHLILSPEGNYYSFAENNAL